MTFEKKRRLSFWLGFALAAALVALAVVGAKYPPDSLLDRFGGLAASASVLGFFVAAMVSSMKNRGYGRDYWTDAGSRGNPYRVIDVRPNLSGAFANGFMRFFVLGLVLGILYVLAFGPK